MFRLRRIMKYQRREQQQSTRHSELNRNMDVGKGKSALKSAALLKIFLNQRVESRHILISSRNMVILPSCLNQHIKERR